MQIENSEKTELLARFGVDLLWGEDWWGEIHKEQTNTGLPGYGVVRLCHWGAV